MAVWGYCTRFRVKRCYHVLLDSIPISCLLYSFLNVLWLVFTKKKQFGMWTENTAVTFVSYYSDHPMIDDESLIFVHIDISMCHLWPQFCVIIAVVMSTCVQCLCVWCSFLCITLYLKHVHSHALQYLHSYSYTPHSHTHTYFTHSTQLGGRSKKKLRHPKASEPQPPDPELDRKMQELERMTDAQINDKLQAMLVSGGIFSNISYYIMMMWCDTLSMIEQLETYLILSFKEKYICGIVHICTMTSSVEVKQWQCLWSKVLLSQNLSSVLSTLFLGWIWCIALEGGKSFTYKDLWAILQL